MPLTDSDIGGVLIYVQDTAGLVLFGTNKGTPPTTADEFAVGCLILDISNGLMYINDGTAAAPVWESVTAVTTEEIADGAVTPVKSANSEAVTATSDGLTTGLISDTARNIAVTSAGATDIITTPAPVVGKVITGYVGANGCEIRTIASSSVKINGVDSDGTTNEAAIPSTTFFKLTCVEADAWILEATTELGVAIVGIVPDAV